MGVTFSTFDTTPATAVAAIKAAILASSDWSNPAGDRVTATTTRGAAMVVDLADAAANSYRLQFGVYRTTGLADKIIRYMYWRTNGTGATSDTLHVTVSASKEHLLVMIEGPRPGEVNPVDTTDGSFRPVFFLCDLVPYFPTTDTIPVVVCGGNTATNTPMDVNSYYVHVSRNAANNASWVQAGLETLYPPRGIPNSSVKYSSRSTSPGGQVVRPYVVIEDAAGLRGRLAQFFNMGWNVIGSTTLGDFPGQVFSRVTVGSVTYIGVLVSKSVSTSSGVSPFAFTYYGNDTRVGSPIVAVPYS